LLRNIKEIIIIYLSRQMRAIQILAILLVAAVQGQGSFDDLALAAHNAARALHQNTDPLTWHAEAAKHAQEWCNQLVTTDSFGHSSGSGYGENLYWSSQILTDGSVWGTAAVTSWYAEKQFWNYDTSTGSGGVTGHFTQVVWQSSTGVGCGFAANPNGGTYPNGYKGTFVCCNYSPPGNYRGQYADNVAPLNPACEWEWSAWGECSAADAVAGVCNQARQQECSCSDESKCAATEKMDKEYQECTCEEEEEKCEWEWTDWGECSDKTVAGTCNQARTQECSCSDESKCAATEKMDKEYQACDCKEKCEWEWGKWSKCTDKDPAADVQICVKTREQECSCMSTDSTTDSCVDGDKQAAADGGVWLWRG